MKKYGLVILSVLILCSVFCLTACTPPKKQQAINYQRKLEKYLPAEQRSTTSNGGAIDLSEGPRLKYDAKMGPGDMNFDVKVVNPYSF